MEQEGRLYDECVADSRGLLAVPQAGRRNYETLISAAREAFDGLRHPPPSTDSMT
jgi:hypothetical protein